MINLIPDDSLPDPKKIKKKDIELGQIKELYRDSINEIRHKCVYETFQPRSLISIGIAKDKFRKLRDKFEFNYFNEKVFNEKSAKVIDFEIELKREIEKINELISKSMNDAFMRIFGKDEDL